MTGGAGFIGVNFMHYWMQNYQDAEIVAIDALTHVTVGRDMIFVMPLMLVNQQRTRLRAS